LTVRPLRIAIFTESYLPYLSGVTVSTEALARGLAEAGHQVLLVAPRPARGVQVGSGGASGPEPRIAWLPSIQLPPPAPRGYRVPARLWSTTRRETVAFEPDLVHTQSPFVAGWMARQVAAQTGAPLVFTHHTRFGDYGHYLGPLAKPGRALLDAHLRRFWARCAAVVAPGSDLADEIRGRLLAGSRPLVAWIPTGIEVGAIRAIPAVDPRLDTGWPTESVVVASLGRLAREKSVDAVLDAFAAAARVEPRARLIFIGGGPRRDALSARSRALGLSDRVHFTGTMPRRDALALLKASDLFAFASLTETQGLVVSEALACGLPVAAVDGPGTRDAVRPGVDGMLVPPGALDEALGELIADSTKRAEMGAAAARGATRFDRADRIAQLVELYRGLLGDRA